ncbi:MAG: KGK domain-containing protein [Cyanobacteria bacterium P01_C01_bin.120]
MSFRPLRPEDVVSIAKNDVMQSFPTTAKQEEIIELIKQRLLGRCNCSDDWFSKGVVCEVMTTAEKGWKTGRIRLQLQFDDTVQAENEVSQG